MVNLFKSACYPSFGVTTFKFSSNFVLTCICLISTWLLFTSSIATSSFFCAERVAVYYTKHLSKFMTASINASVDLNKFAESEGMTWSSAFGLLWPIILVYYVRTDLKRPWVNCFNRIFVIYNSDWYIVIKE